MTDVLSLVVTVTPDEDVTVPAHLGRAVHALLLRWLDTYDAALAKRWHDTSGPKPFTASTLIGGGRVNAASRLLRAGGTYWFRLTALVPEVSAALLARAETPPLTVDLDGVLLPVTSITADPDAHQWAGSATYQELAAPYLLARERAPRRVRLRFVSPVSFKQNNLHMPVPMPDLVFGSLADRWNAFSPVAVSSGVRDFCRFAVAISSLDLRSRGLPLKGGVKQVGSLGKMTYPVVRHDPYWASVLGLLADAAFYTGVGRYTTVGMGQAVRLDA